MAESRAASEFGLGCVNLGHASCGGVRAGISLVHLALDLGVRFFDTADAYGDGTSEVTIGRALRARRADAFIATKAGYVFRERSTLERRLRRAASPAVAMVRRHFPQDSGLARLRPSGYVQQDFTPRNLRTAVDASLRRLCTDHVDLLQLHAPPQVCGDDLLALAQDLRAEGKILEFGVGLGSLEHAFDWIATGSLDAIQLPYGVLDPHAGEAVIPSAVEADLRVIARSIFAGGFVGDDADDRLLRSEQPRVRAAVRKLAAELDVTPLQVAAWFVTSHPGISTVLVGASSRPHLRQSLGYVTSNAPAGLRDRLRAMIDEAA